MPAGYGAEAEVVRKRLHILLLDLNERTDSRLGAASRLHGRHESVLPCVSIGNVPSKITDRLRAGRQRGQQRGGSMHKDAEGP